MKQFIKPLDIALLVLAIVSVFTLDNSIALWFDNAEQSNLLPVWFVRFMDFVRVGAHGTVVLIGGVGLWAGGRVLRKITAANAGKHILLAYVITGIIAQLLKHLVGRARPGGTDGRDALLFLGPTWNSSYSSFPSGHTAVMFALATVLSWRFREYRAIFFAVAVLVAFERVYSLWHFISDVLAGAALGMVAGRVVLHLWPLGTNKTDEALDTEVCDS